MLILVCLMTGALAMYAPYKVSQLAPAKKGEKNTESLLFFDGVCNLCHSFVTFTLSHGPLDGSLKFGPIQQNAKRMRQVGAGAFAEGGDQFLRSVVLVQNGQIYVRSDAALRVIAMFHRPFSYLSVLHVLPISFRDSGYKLVAKWRYRIFGESVNIRDPPQEYKHLFVYDS